MKNQGDKGSFLSVFLSFLNLILYDLSTHFLFVNGVRSFQKDFFRKTLVQALKI